MDQLHQLSAQYNALWIETNQLYETWARQRGMSLYELLVILSIVEADGTVLQKDICQRFAIPKQTVNAIIKTLTDKGWLELKVSEQDRRSRKLSLTPEGSAHRRRRSPRRFRSTRHRFGSGWDWTGRNS